MDKVLGLGKGLSALMGEDETSFGDNLLSENKVCLLDIHRIVPCSFQPRRVFDENALSDLVASIREKGVLQPLLVRKCIKSDNYEVIAGERRLRASKEAGLSVVPVLIKDFDDKTTLEVALIENLQRENLNPFEEGEAYLRLMKEFGYTQEVLSQVVGKSRSHLANMMRLTDLPDIIKEYVLNKELTIGHARALLTASFPEKLAKRVVQKGLTVRQTEKLAAESKTSALMKGKNVSQKDSDILTLETELKRILKTPVSIQWTGKKGKIIIHYQNLDQLDILLQRLMNLES